MILEDWRKMFLEKKTMFEKLKTLKVNEKLRPGKISNYERIIETCRNFRKIDID